MTKPASKQGMFTVQFDRLIFQLRSGALIEMFTNFTPSYRENLRIVRWNGIHQCHTIKHTCSETIDALETTHV